MGRQLSSIRKQWLAPGGFGAVAGVLVTLLLGLPAWFDQTDQIALQDEQFKKQETRMLQLERDFEAYAKLMNDFRDILNNPDLSRSLLPEDAETIALIQNEDDFASDNDSYWGVALKQTDVGVYFLWCAGGYNSFMNNSEHGYWLTKSQAISWAHKHLKGGDFPFSEEDRSSQTDYDLDLCPGI